MPVFPFTAFSVRDDDLVIVESIAGEQYIRAENRSDEVAGFIKFFDLLREAASTGSAAAAVIQQALDDLRAAADLDLASIHRVNSGCRFSASGPGEADLVVHVGVLFLPLTGSRSTSWPLTRPPAGCRYGG